jgi:hypothetical protein
MDSESAAQPVLISSRRDTGFIQGSFGRRWPTVPASSRLSAYWRLGGRWAIWGVLATLVPLADLYVMVFKP